ncbi:hypothetical protein JX266_009138 [Neoarthrinium moseri]|nr:hypothetical protein JX266_009138 [Neoarthrinium moseri]
MPASLVLSLRSFILALSLSNLFSTVRPNSGVTIILQSYENGVSKYCCNSLAVIPGSSIPLCYNDTPTFTLDDANVIPGKLELANFTNTADGQSSSATSAVVASPGVQDTGDTGDAAQCAGKSHETVIGVSIGVPLAIIAIAAITWAIWERRKKRALEQSAAPPVDQSGSYQHYYAQSPYDQNRQLDTQKIAHSGTPSELHSRQVPELG